MSAVSSLRKLICETALVSETVSKPNSYKLTEDSEDYSLAILNCPDDIVIFKCDKFPPALFSVETKGS